ncbi:MAG: 30S ribosomal protein S17 [Candidatus Omnitrophota bacterium]
MKRKRRKQMGKTSYIGEVVSDKMQKTRIVKTTRKAKHIKYGKIIKKVNKYKVHDEKNVSKMGDTVRIEETRPISKDKRYKLVEVIKKIEISQVKEE